MAIQVKQEFPHCERCGIMIHERQRRIEAAGPGATRGSTARRSAVTSTSRCMA